MSPFHTELRSCAALVALVAIGACSQATAAPASSQNETSMRIDGSETLRYRTDIREHDTPLALAPEAAWQRVLRAYSALRLPVTVVDSARHVIGSQNARVRDQLAGERMSTWISCGQTSIGTRRADSYTIYLTTLTQVRPAATGSTVGSIVTATAESPDGTTRGVQCSSTGALEERLDQVLTTP